MYNKILSLPHHFTYDIAADAFEFEVGADGGGVDGTGRREKCWWGLGCWRLCARPDVHP